MAKVELKDISKVYEGNVRAIEKANIVVEDKEFVVFVGPSGCGKSTTLRMIAGLEEITEGELLIDGERMNDIPPKDRNIAMVFQNYALYPHMTVYNNMAFALKIKKTPKKEIDARVREAAKILDIEKFLERKPKALSGGQRQRVAVGRAIVRNPKVFLFDEPLSNLDAKLRVTMRAEISALHRRLNATMIYVTHDQVEAMTMADRIVVFNTGKVQQIGSPLYIYNNPINKFVAGFIGSPPMNFMLVKVIDDVNGIMLDEGSFKLRPAASHIESLKKYAGKELYFGIRPENLSFCGGGSGDGGSGSGDGGSGNDGGGSVEEARETGTMSLSVHIVEPLGAEMTIWLRSGSSKELVARTWELRDYKINDKVDVKPDMNAARYFDKESELAILPLPEGKEMEAARS